MKSRISLPKSITSRLKLAVSIIVIAAICLSFYYYLGLRGELGNLPPILVSGILVGGLYGLVAVGVSIILGVMRVINLCHGELLVLGGFFTFWAVNFGLDPFLAMPIAFIILFVLGLALQSFIINPLLKYGLNPPVLVTFGVALAFQNIMLLLWTPDVRIIHTAISDINLQISGISIPMTRVVALLIALVLAYLTRLFLVKTFFGKALRAISQNSEVALLMGIDTSRVNIFCYGLGAGLAAVAGSLIGIVFSFSPVIGGPYMHKAFAVVVLGGMGNVIGAVVGGIILGVSETFASWLLGGGYTNAVAYLIFILVLIIKPTGIFAK